MNMNNNFWNKTLPIIMMLSLLGCGGGNTESDANTADMDASIKTIHKIQVDNIEREFIVYVPAQVQSMENVPVVFMLHGTGGDGEKFYNISRWREKADVENFIVVFPTALVHCFHQDRNLDGDFLDLGELRVETKWAGGELGETRLPLCSVNEILNLASDKRIIADHPLADDIKYIDHILDFLEMNYSVDNHRIYASGFSNGGVMTSRLSAELSHRFAAVAAAAGVLSVPPQPIRPHSFVFSVGNEDDRFKKIFSLSSLPQTESLFTDVPDFMPLVVEPMLIILGLTDHFQYQEINMSGKLTNHFTFSDSSVGENNSYTMIVIEGLGHEYPNGVNHPVVLVDYLWDFFRPQFLLN